MFRRVARRPNASSVAVMMWAGHHRQQSTGSMPATIDDAKKLANGTELKGKFDATGQRLLEGIAALPDGRVFKGAFDPNDGRPLSLTQLEEDGDFYVGHYNAKWQREGVGEAWLADGTHYKGIFAADEFVEGTAEIPSPGGSAGFLTFTGALKDEQFVRGVLKDRDYTYTGSFEGNAPHGSGKLEYATGALQAGTFYRGQLHGPECKMRLESGHIYLGTFTAGKIHAGELRTPTFNYEGSFDGNGLPEGVGRMETLTTSPKHIFEGYWSGGVMTSGHCRDEYGNPVDWKNSGQQEAVAGKTKEGVAMDTFAHVKLREAMALQREADAAYHSDASEAHQATRRYPSKYELGYEGGSVPGSRAQARQAVSTQRQEKLAEEYQHAATAPDTSEAMQRARDHAAANPSLPPIDPRKAKVAQQEELAAQTVVRQRMQEQLARFNRHQQQHAARCDPSSATSPADDAQPGATPKRRIETNAAWKGMTEDA